MKRQIAILATVFALVPQAIGTPIVVVSTKDGFVIGTNSVDTGGKHVCKTHYAGSTVVLRSTKLARLFKDPAQKELIYDSTLDEWRVLDPKQDMSSIASKTKQFFIQSTNHLADLDVQDGRTKNDVLKKIQQGVVVVGFSKGVPTLYAYSLNFQNGSLVPSDGYPMNAFERKMLWWNGQPKPVVIDAPPNLTLEDAHAAVKDELGQIFNAEKDIAFGPPWEIVHVTPDGVTWLEGNQDLCEKDRKEWSSK
jgi:hypothetical protein